MDEGEPTLHCGLHGPGRRISFVCTHIAHGLLDGTSPGFVVDPEEGETLPIGWCDSCDPAARTRSGDWETFKAAADFKMLCEDCYAEARGLAIDTNCFRNLGLQARSVPKFR